MDFEEKKALTLHGLVLATLVSQTAWLLRLAFAAPKGKKQFLLYRKTTCFVVTPGSTLYVRWVKKYLCCKLGGNFHVEVFLQEVILRWNNICRIGTPVRMDCEPLIVSTTMMFCEIDFCIGLRLRKYSSNKIFSINNKNFSIYNEDFLFTVAKYSRKNSFFSFWTIFSLAKKCELWCNSKQQVTMTIVTKFGHAT